MADIYKIGDSGYDENGNKVFNSNDWTTGQSATLQDENQMFVNVGGDKMTGGLYCPNLTTSSVVFSDGTIQSSAAISYDDSSVQSDIDTLIFTSPRASIEAKWTQLSPLFVHSYLHHLSTDFPLFKWVRYYISSTFMASIKLLCRHSYYFWIPKTVK